MAGRLVTQPDPYAHTARIRPEELRSLQVCEGRRCPIPRDLPVCRWVIWSHRSGGRRESASRRVRWRKCLDRMSVPPAQLLFGLPYRMKLVDQVGRGIRRIRVVCLPEVSRQRHSPSGIRPEVLHSFSRPNVRDALLSLHVWRLVFVNRGDRNRLAPAESGATQPVAFRNICSPADCRGRRPKKPPTPSDWPPPPSAPAKLRLIPAFILETC